MGFSVSGEFLCAFAVLDVFPSVLRLLIYPNVPLLQEPFFKTISFETF